MRLPYLCVAILLLPAASTAQLSTHGNQLWQQGSGGLADSPEGDDNFGFALAAGDFDGDGFTDAAIAAPGEDSERGVVHVLFGAPQGLTSIDAQLWKPGAEGFPDSWESGDQSGAALAAGDFNGDGFDDLAIGSPGEDGFQGAVNILYGSQGAGLTLVGVRILNQNDLDEGGPEDDDRFGFALAVGDFNNDGFDDLSIGSPGEDDSRGVVYTVYGSTTGITTSGNRRWSQGEDGIAGSQEGDDLFGYALAAGDVNGDSFDDLLIGTPGEDGREGQVEVLFGSGGGITASGSRRLKQGQDGIPGGADDGDFLGGVLAVGDFNSDGYDDIAASAPGDAAARGNVTIIPGSAAGPTSVGADTFSQIDAFIHQQVREGGDLFGSSLASGDFNLDGYEDLAISARGEDDGAGIVHVFLGTDSGLGPEGNEVFIQGFQGMQGDARAGDAFGYAMVAGDFGGDLASDLLIGSPGDDDGDGRGIAQLLLGNQKPTINAIVSAGLGLPAITTLSPNTLATVFGVSLFAPGLGRTVGEGDLSGGGLPRILDDTCLLINGKRSPLVFLRDDQVNFQALSENSGQLEIRIVRNCEGSYPLESNVFTVSAAPVSPDIFAYAVGEDGSKLVAAINETTGKRVGPRDLRPEFEPAKAEEIVAIYVTGLGLTSPAFAPGQLPPNDASGAAPAPSVVVLIDGIEAEVLYAGTAPGFAGLYQINVVIPATPNVGEVSILITSSGGGPAAATPNNAFIAVE